MRRLSMLVALAALVAVPACDTEPADPVEDVLVLTSQKPNEALQDTDSVTVCATYTTLDGLTGLMKPAMVLRFSPDSVVQAEYDKNVVSRCVPVLRQHGLQLGTGLIRKVEKWSMRDGERRKMTTPNGWRT